MDNYTNAYRRQPAWRQATPSANCQIPAETQRKIIDEENQTWWWQVIHTPGIQLTGINDDKSQVEVIQFGGRMDK
jgi:hypothetical protein